MTIDEMRTRKLELGLTNEMIAERSGVPLGTVQKIFAGVTKAPRWHTLQQLERVLSDRKVSVINYQDIMEGNEPLMVSEGAPAYMDPKQGHYTIDDYYAMPEDRRVELIDGVIYDMTSPTSIHQLVLLQLYLMLAPCVEEHPECEIFIAPCDVRLDRDNRTMLQPDIFIVCDDEQITKKRIEGAPSFVIEVLSPSTRGNDLFRKLNKYRFAGVREYWIVDPEKLYVLVYDLENEDPPVTYSFHDIVPVRISNGECSVDFNRVFRKIEKYLDA